MMLQIPLKKTDNISFAPILKKYISQNYKEKSDIFDAECNEFDQLRQQAFSAPSVELLSRYLGQLKNLITKFPVSEKALKVSFAWYHSFLPKKKFLSYHTTFERTCVLFNLASILSQRAFQQSFSTEDGLKNACTYYQQAAGVYQTLCDLVKLSYDEVVSTDLSPHILKSFQILMLAQAQECALWKAKIEQKPASALAKIAIQAADMYDEAYDLAKTEPHPFEKVDWLAHLQIKALYLHAFAQFTQSKIALEERKYGEEICRVDVAVDNAQKAIELAKKNTEITKEVKVLLEQAYARQKSATKENEKLHKEVIPNFTSLPPLQRILLVKTSFLSELSDPRVTGSPLFEKLVPLSVHKYATEYKAKKDEYVQRQLNKIEDATHKLKTALGQLNISASLDALEHSEGLPDYLLLQSDEIKNNGGATELVISFNKLVQKNQELLSIIDDAVDSLVEEEEEDASLRTRLQTRIRRAAASLITENFHYDARKYREMTERAAEADSVVRNKMDEFFPTIEKLSGEARILEKLVPSCVLHLDYKKDSLVISLRQKIYEANRILQDAQSIIQELKNLSERDDIVPRLLETYGSKTIPDPREAYEKQMSVYTPYVQKIVDHIMKMENVLQQIRNENNKLGHLKDSVDESFGEREEALKELYSGCLAYHEIKENVKTGLKFYADLENLVKDLRTKCKDLRLARKLQVLELVNDTDKTFVPSPRHSQLVMFDTKDRKTFKKPTTNSPSKLSKKDIHSSTAQIPEEALKSNQAPPPHAPSAYPKAPSSVGYPSNANVYPRAPPHPEEYDENDHEEDEEEEEEEEEQEHYEEDHERPSLKNHLGHIYGSSYHARTNSMPSLKDLESRRKPRSQSMPPVDDREADEFYRRVHQHYPAEESIEEEPSSQQGYPSVPHVPQPHVHHYGYPAPHAQQPPQQKSKGSSHPHRGSNPHGTTRSSNNPSPSAAQETRRSQSPSPHKKRAEFYTYSKSSTREQRVPIYHPNHSEVASNSRSSSQYFTPQQQHSYSDPSLSPQGQQGYYPPPPQGYYAHPPNHGADYYAHPQPYGYPPQGAYYPQQQQAPQHYGYPPEQYPKH